jgi:glutaconyl-CoA decarboxylase
MKNLKITVNGVAYDVQVEEVGGAASSAPVAAAPAAAPAAPAAPKAAHAAAGGEAVNSPMPGTVLEINVKVGDTVKSGDTLVVLEAMKMENAIVAPKDAKVVAVHVTKGQSVESGAALVSLG